MAAITNTTTFALLDLANSTLEQDNMTFGSTIASVNYNTPFNDIPDLRPEKETTSYKLYLDYKLYYFIIDVILILPTIFGNSLIIISLIRFKNLRKTKTFILIGNLGISDLLVGLVFFPMDLVIIHKPALWQDQVMCVCYKSIIFTFLTASVLNLFLLSLERFHAITRPLQHNSVLTTKRIYYTACIIWIFVILTGFTPLYLFSSGHLNFINFESCTDIFLFDSPYILVMNCIAIIALVITFGLFVVVIRIALRKASRKPLEIGDKADYNNNSRHNLRRDIRHTRLMVIVSGTFIICWAPYCISSLIPSQSAEILSLRYWLASLGIINSCLNWIVYGAINKRFRAAFIRILTCYRRKPGENVKIIAKDSKISSKAK